MSHDLWLSLAKTASLDFDPAQIARLDSYLDLLIAANQQMNLTRITDRAAAEILHVGDALTLLPHLPKAPHRLADVGAGGGVPGIVLAIARPDVRVTLIESTQKKANFLRSAAAQLKLENVIVLSVRAEDAARASHREAFDITVARAVALLPALVEWLLPLTKIGGAALAMKGPKGLDELNQSQRAIRLLGGEKAEVIPVELPQTAGHLLIKIRKTARTPARFPRPSSAAGQPL
jgi:16S rRNA (guanine527-N7)-methyltransferase